ncbi:MAG: DUF5686 family protein [Bacteroidales bacterium]
MGNLNKHKHKLVLLVFLLFPVITLAQDALKGRITDAETGKPLAFVNVIYNDERQGTTTDLDGYFNIPAENNPQFLKCSFVGYEKKHVKIPGNKGFIEISLKPKAYSLNEVMVLPGENPAHRIIKGAIGMRDKHAPHNLDSYAYTSYSKFFITMEVDSLRDLVEKDTTGQISDTSSIAKTVKFLNEKHLFLMESVTEKTFEYPDKESEEILASRMSGLKKPFFTYMASQFQSFSFYRQSIDVGGQKFISPLCDNCHEKYFFLLRDSLFSQTGDTSFVISFRPRKNTNFKGLEGFITITSDDWAIENVSAEPYEKGGMFDIKIQQKYEKVDGQHWFPVQLNTDFIFKFARGNAESISIGSDTASSNRMPMIGTGKTYIRDIDINTPTDEKIRGGTKIEYDKKSAKRDTSWWQDYRQTPLNPKEKETYRLIDSVGEANNFDRLVESIEIIATGAIPWKIFNIRLNDLLWYNEYEGYRLGLGLETNNRLSEYFRLHSFAAYGFRDEEFKYGGGIALRPLKNNQLIFDVGYSYDVRPSNQIGYEQRLFSTESFRTLFIREMDYYNTWTASVKTNPFRGFYAKAYLDYNQIDVTNNYRFFHREFISDVKEWQAGLELHWVIKENILRTPEGNVIGLGSKYPEIYFNIRKGLPYKAASGPDYWRLDSRIEQTFKTRWAGSFHLSIDGGYVIGEGDNYLQNFYMPGTGVWLDADKSFATMRPHDFIADRFAAVFFKYDIGSLLFSIKNWKPEFAAVTRACIGDYDFTHPQLFPYNTGYKPASPPSDGYIESGLQFNALLRQSFFKYGAGVYYHYGPGSAQAFKDNVAVKFRLEYAF